VEEYPLLKSGEVARGCAHQIKVSSRMSRGKGISQQEKGRGTASGDPPKPKGVRLGEEGGGGEGVARKREVLKPVSEWETLPPRERVLF